MTNNLWYYQMLDFPQLPVYLVSKFDQLVKERLLGLPDNVYTPQSPRTTDGYINHIQYKDLSEKKSGSIVYHELTNEFESWIKGNITEQYKRVKFSIHHGDIAPPHTDYLRDFGINYIHVLGGDNVKTVWYQEEGFPVVRDGRCRQPNYQKLSVLEEVVLPVNQWHILRTDILHSVENLQSNRIRITVDLDRSAVDGLEKHFIKGVV